MSICRAIQVLGLPLYQISRHVASTFKRLATTTIHCNLINFYQHRRVNFQVMLLHMTPSMIFIVIAR
jgi:hypothetical protein